MAFFLLTFDLQLRVSVWTHASVSFTVCTHTEAGVKDASECRWKSSIQTWHCIDKFTFPATRYWCDAAYLEEVTPVWNWINHSNVKLNWLALKKTFSKLPFWMLIGDYSDSGHSFISHTRRISSPLLFS